MSLFDNRVHLQDCENNGEVSSDTSASPTASTNDAGAVIQGTNSISFQVDDAQEAILFYQDSSASLINVDMTDVTVYLNVKHNICESFANLGGHIVLGDGVQTTPGDVVGYNVVGNDVAGFPYLFRFTSIKLDVSVIVASPGTNDVDYYQYFGTEGGLNHAAILQIGYGSFSVEKAVSTGKNAWIDGIYYIANSTSSTTGYAVSIEGGSSGTPETMTDVAADDVAVGMGLFNNPKGSEYGFFGPTQWGDAASGDTYFTATDNQWFWIGDNAGGHVVASPHFPFRLVGESGSTNSWVLLRVVIVNTGRRAEFYMEDANMDFVQMDSCTLVDIGAITMNVANDVDKFLVDTVFVNCDQIDPGRMNMDRVTFNGSNDATGAILFDEVQSGNSDLTDLTFNSSGSGYGIRMRPTGGGPFTYNFDNFQNTGFGVDDTADSFIDVDPVTSSADITINLQNGAGTITTDTTGHAGTLTINNAVEVGASGVTEGTSIKIIADETVGTITVGDVIAQGFADNTGEFKNTGFNYESAFDPSGLDVIVRARNQGIAVAVIAEDGGAFVDETDEASSNSTADMTLLPTTPAANDAYNFGHDVKFSAVRVDISTALAFSGQPTVVWEYYNGTIFTALSGVTDGTQGFEIAGDNKVTFTIPGDWVVTTINSQGPLFYIRARLSVLGTITTTPIGTKATLNTQRFIPYNASRTIVSGTGLADIATWVQDNISTF